MNWTTPEIRNDEFQAEMTAGLHLRMPWRRRRWLRHGGELR